MTETNGGKSAPAAETNVSLEAKRAALAEVLESRTFARSEQLKHFLAYVCELEFVGRAAEIKEYAIGTEALGRPADYSPHDDSTVRTRAYSLRQKLQEFYENEGTAATVRIELAKGSYVPLFYEAPPSVAPSRAAGEERATGGGKWSRRIAPFLVGVAAASAIWLSATLLRRTAGRMVPPDSILAEAWGPLARPDSNVAICFSTPPHLHLRSFARSPNGIPQHNPPLLPAVPEVKAFYETFRMTPPGTPVYMWRTNNSMLLGDAMAGALAVSTLSSLGASFEVLPEKMAGPVALKGRNIMRFGSPTDSRDIALELKRARFSIYYDPGELEEVVTDRVPGTPGATKYVSSRQLGGFYYAILTVMPSEDSGSRHRTVIASGVSSGGAHAAMQYFSSVEHLRELKSRFAAQGLHGFPPAYQVILKYVIQNAVSVRFVYENHVVLK